MRPTVAATPDSCAARRRTGGLQVSALVVGDDIRQQSLDMVRWIELTITGVFAVHIDGLSDTGKSTLRDELARRGYEATDADAEFGSFGDPVTGQESDFIRQSWIWDVSRLGDLGGQPRDSPVFICGGVVNQDECIEPFTPRLLLCIDSETMRRRLLIRIPTAKDPAELAEQLGLNRRPEWTVRRPGWTAVDAAQPIDDVEGAVVRQCARRQ